MEEEDDMRERQFERRKEFSSPHEKSNFCHEEMRGERESEEGEKKSPSVPYVRTCVRGRKGEKKWEEREEGEEKEKVGRDICRATKEKSVM